MINEKDIQKGYLVPAGVPQEVTVKKPAAPGDLQRDAKARRRKKSVPSTFRTAAGVWSLTPGPGVDIQVNGRSYGKSPVTVDDLDPTKAAKVVAKSAAWAPS